MPVPQRAAAITDLSGHHVALREEVAAQTVSTLVGINLVVLLWRCNRSRHQRMCHLDLGGRAESSGDTYAAAISYREATTGKDAGDRKPSPPRQLMGERRRTFGKRSTSV